MSKRVNRWTAFVLATLLVLWAGATRAHDGHCPGDCDASGAVSTSDLVSVVNVALGRMPMDACIHADMRPTDDRVEINEVVLAVQSALNGCNCSGARVSYSSTFEGIQKHIFERRGCTLAACHGSAPGQGALDLSPALAYDSLYQVPSTQVTMNRVTPGARDRSYLYMKLAAATDPSQLNGFQIANQPMPFALEPLSAAELEVVRLWIYNGAPRTGTVPGTESLLGACLPPAQPISIEPLEPPATGEGVQFVMPEWLLEKESEFEGCYATYYDFTGQIPDEFLDPTGKYFRWKGFEVRQDPQSHHLLLYYSPLNIDPGVDPHHSSFGRWTCRGGPRNRVECDPVDLDFCGDGGVCASQFRSSFACVGFGPPSALPAEIIGGAPQAQTNFLFAPGVYQQLTVKGVLYWNPHAFNTSTKDHIMRGRVNFYFADKREYQGARISNFGAIFKPNNPPFTKQTFCNDHTFPIGSRVFLMFGHTHKHGERFWVTDRDGELIYDNYSYSDPVLQRYEPPLEFDSMNRAERTVTYCATYNNGVDPDGAPNVELVTRASRVPKSAQQFIGRCTPVACVEGRIAEPCQTDADCDTAPERGDGWCDACPITGGESTENEMFVLFGAFYIDPTVPGAETEVLPFPE